MMTYMYITTHTGWMKKFHMLQPPELKPYVFCDSSQVHAHTHTHMYEMPKLKPYIYCDSSHVGACVRTFARACACACVHIYSGSSTTLDRSTHMCIRPSKVRG